jgi:hypothetical protein
VLVVVVPVVVGHGCVRGRVRSAGEASKSIDGQGDGHGRCVDTTGVNVSGGASQLQQYVMQPPSPIVVNIDEPQHAQQQQRVGWDDDAIKVEHCGTNCFTCDRNGRVNDGPIGHGYR